MSIVLSGSVFSQAVPLELDTLVRSVPTSNFDGQTWRGPSWVNEIFNDSVASMYPDVWIQMPVISTLMPQLRMALDYTCCPGPGCCSIRLYWDLSECNQLNPTDSNLDGCTNLDDLLELLANYGLCTVP